MRVGNEETVAKASNGEELVSVAKMAKILRRL
jgi:hypothetical protein